MEKESDELVASFDAWCDRHRNEQGMVPWSAVQEFFDVLGRSMMANFKIYDDSHIHLGDTINYDLSKIER